MKCKGMTLLEVLFAMAILALAGITLLNSGAEKVRNLERLQQKQLAAWGAEDLAINIKLSKTLPEGTSQPEKFQVGEKSFYRWWRIQATSYKNVYLLQIDVSADERHEDNLYSLKTWLVKK
ncbi:type II secretion system minor pseudopilin GspI [Erwinia sp. BNK-24-b]|uniref:type II secretion system minor pseudopilin GspI n=1 Tax=Erwinia TaxID=551 RepID=UPI001FF05460|nr:type II secretion system minor pseudopilin GspI [Erwinia phyllosphaerae]MBV4368886.1 type II secretion system minor pseudopilin GspI [Erwinia phyllosphaerae]